MGGGGEGIREGLKELLPEIEGFKVYIHRVPGSGVCSVLLAFFYLGNPCTYIGALGPMHIHGYMDPSSTA